MIVTFTKPWRLLASMKHSIYIVAILLFFGSEAFGQGSVDTCLYLRQWESASPQPGDTAAAREQYDTLRLYIEHCAATDPRSYFAFGDLDGAVQVLNNDTSRFSAYRAWLISVLYLNPAVPEYFCACMGSIAGTYQVGKFDPLGYLAVLNYLRTYHRECWNSNGDKEYAQDSAYDAQHFQDPRHLPSLDSMGLGFLLHQNAVTPAASLPQQYLGSFTTSPNPFKQETTLEFTLNRMEYITVDVYDVLGHKVWGSDHGSTMDAGEHQIRIDGASLSSGTYYARISTGFGVVKTVKLVKE
jgi:hypothetical protein